MKKSEKFKDDLVEKWIRETGGDSAPEGFSRNVMSRIELEPISHLHIYRNPLGKAFKYIVGSIIILLLIAGLFQPSMNLKFLADFELRGLADGLLDSVSGFFSEIAFGNSVFYILIITVLAFSFLLSDNLLRKIFK